MSKTKLLVAAVCLLVAVNLFMMWQLARRHDMPCPQNQKIIIEKLGLDAAQVAQYDVHVNAHRRDIRMYEDSLKMLKTELYTATLVSSDTAAAQVVIAKIDGVHQAIEWVHYRHFEAIRALCRPDQLPAFTALTQDLAAMFNPRNALPNRPGQ